jgi:hypothetical protein
MILTSFNINVKKVTEEGKPVRIFKDILPFAGNANEVCRDTC